MGAYEADVQFLAREPFGAVAGDWAGLATLPRSIISAGGLVRKLGETDRGIIEILVQEMGFR